MLITAAESGKNRFERFFCFLPLNLSASLQLFEREKRLAIIMIVPYQHLGHGKPRARLSLDSGLPEQGQFGSTK